MRLALRMLSNTHPRQMARSASLACLSAQRAVRRRFFAAQTLAPLTHTSRHSTASSVAVRSHAPDSSSSSSGSTSSQSKMWSRSGAPHPGCGRVKPSAVVTEQSWLQPRVVRLSTRPPAPHLAALARGALEPHCLHLKVAHVLSATGVAALSEAIAVQLGQAVARNTGANMQAVHVLRHQKLELVSLHERHKHLVREGRLGMRE